MTTSPPWPTPPQTRAKLLEDPGFGRVFTDHMTISRWTTGGGWSPLAIEPRKALSLDPSASVIQYAQSVFEGLKAYRTPAGAIQFFRPADNAKRFAASAERLAMTPVPEALFIEAVEDLVRADAEWTPRSPGALYLRPVLFSTEPVLGVRPSSEFTFCVFASPVGAYFKGGSKAISVWVSDSYTRAAPGGTGAAKCAGNYAAALIAQAHAIKQGCDQVVFLDAVERRWIEVVGGMNVFFVFDDGSIVTPPLNGAILPGITRNSLLALAQDNGHHVEERAYSIEEWKVDAASGWLREAFACGTAAVVAAIGEVRSQSGGFTIGDCAEGPITTKLRDQLTAIQFGAAPDTHGWAHPLPLGN